MERQARRTPAKQWCNRSWSEAACGSNNELGTDSIAVDGEVIANAGYEKLKDVREVRFFSPMQGG